MGYACLSKQSYELEQGFLLRPIAAGDMELIRVWRNAQISILRQDRPISSAEQQAYFEREIQPDFSSKQPKQVLFVMEKNDRMLGYGGLVHFDWSAQRGELSFLLDPQILEENDEFQACFKIFVEWLIELAKQELHLHRLVAEVFAFRKTILKLLEQAGFLLEGVLRDHVFKNGKFQDSFCLGLLLPTSREGVLISSVSKKIPLIQAVRKACRHVAQFSRVCGMDAQEKVIGRYFVDHFWHCASLDKLAIEEVIDYCHAQSIKAIIPTSNRDLLFFCKHKLLLLEKRIQLLSSELSLIALCVDKLQFAEGLLKRGFPAIPTFLAGGDCPGDFFVVKERLGAGSKGLGLNLSKAEAVRFAKKLSQPIFQPYIVGIEFSVDVYVDIAGKGKGAVARERNLVVDGESQVTTTVKKPKIEALALSIAESFGFYGHIVLQMIETKDKKIYVVECNPRFGGASTTAIEAGLDSFTWFLEECLGNNLKPYQPNPYNLCQVRYPTDKIVYGERNVF